LIDVDVVGAEFLQRAVEARDGALRQRIRVADAERRFRADDDPVARRAGERLAEYRLGAGGPPPVEQVDAEIERGADNLDRMRLVFAGAEPQAAEAAAAETGDADLEAGAAKCRVIHALLLAAFCARGQRGVRRKGGGKSGRTVIAATGITGRSSARATTNCRTMRASTKVASVSANCAPMQTRGPMPNGR